MKSTKNITGSLEHFAWIEMRRRCNPSSPKYRRRYADRGITICERWGLFANFLSDMGAKPSHAHSLDRIDNDGNYEPNNCRWATVAEQNSNKTTTKRLTINGESKHVAEWARTAGVDRSAAKKIADRYDISEADYFNLKMRGLIVPSSHRTKDNIAQFKNDAARRV